MHSLNEFSACDSRTSVGELKAWVDQFASERNWEQFHRPKNLAMSAAIEAAELMEHFQWGDPNPQDMSEAAKKEVGEELSDVLSYLLRLASVLQLDIAKSLEQKMVKNAVKYPVSGS